MSFLQLLLKSNFSHITIMFLVCLDVIAILGRCCFVSQTMKMKSSHDVLHDPKLSSQPVVETTATEVKVHVTDLFSCVIINNNNNNNNNLFV